MSLRQGSRAAAPRGGTPRAQLRAASRRRAAGSAGPLPRAGRRGAPRSRCGAVEQEGEKQAASGAAPGGGNGSSNGASAEPAFPLVKPENLRLEPGELSKVHPVGTEPETDDSMENLWRFEPDGYLKAILTAQVYDVAEVTPLQKAEKLSDALENTVLLKREDMQPVKSFKLRGAYNRMSRLTPDELARGVICSSAGNHAQGVALSAQTMGTSAVICMPLSTPRIKIDAVERLGGMVELVGETYNETQAYAMERAEADGRVFIAPFDDPYTIAGQGTIAAEIVQQIRHLDDLDVVFVAVGGGGLIAGVAAYLKKLKPSIKVIGVEPTGANAMAQSLEAGRRVALSKVDVFADGVAVKLVGKETFRLCQKLVDGVVLVDNSAVSAAIKDVFNETRSILEPAGAVALAGCKDWIKRNEAKEHTCVVITSGANINFDRLRLVSELANVGGKTEVMLASTIPEQPGAFMEFVRVVTETAASVDFTEFKYRFCATSDARVLYSVSLDREFDIHELTTRLEENGMPTVDCSNMQPALTHLRYMVGGRPRSFTGELPGEKMMTIEFPEVAGSLMRFLQAFDGFNITMFHYRAAGNTKTELLVGIQVPPEAEPDFARVSEDLETHGFIFSLLEGQTREVFNDFLQ